MAATDEADAGRVDAAAKVRRGIERRVARYAGEQDLLPAGGRVLVAVSGGPDSSALLLILGALARRQGLELTAAYFDHCLRGAEGSASEREAVSALAVRCAVDLVTGSGDVAALRKTKRLTLEEAARRARYDFLAGAAEERGISTVALGHTRDDQAETVLMHLIRGSGLTGLGGMHPKSRWPSAGHPGLQVVRPLLRLSRVDTLAYCEASGWTPVEDVSNASSAFLRNRVRQELLPLLRRYNPRVEESLARFADAAREDAGVLEARAAEALLPEEAPSGLEVRVDRARLRAMPAALRKHAVRLALLRLSGDLQGFSERHLAAIEQAATGAAGGGRLDLPRGLTAAIRHNAVLLKREASPAAGALPAEGARLAVPAEARLGDLIVAAGGEVPAGAIASVVVDGAALGPEVCVRAWRPGDRMQPAGMAGTKKLQDIFVDARVPREERAGVPVFESARGIAWVGGMRFAEWARPREGSATVVLSYREAT